MKVKDVEVRSTPFRSRNRGSVPFTKKPGPEWGIIYSNHLIQRMTENSEATSRLFSSYIADVLFEVSDDGSVPELNVSNKGNRPILIPEGEILVGAKQNRVVNVTVLVAAHSEFTVPVSCVEQGRWRYQSREFRSEYCATPSLRSKKMRSVQRNRAECGR